MPGLRDELGEQSQTLQGLVCQAGELDSALETMRRILIGGLHA